jgi:tetratricopeptide (TPR) repeat protein
MDDIVALNRRFNLASTYRNQARWKKAEEHPDKLTSTANLASTYRNQGRWKEAEELEVRVMETRKGVLGEEHPSTLTSMGDLALRYKNQGRWKESEEDLDTATSMANAASTYRNHARWKKAEEHPDTPTSMAYPASRRYRNQARWKKAEEHPETPTSMANPASTYRNQGRWKAEELDVQVMETNLRVLGAEHPDTLASMANLASTFWNQGRWKEAEELFVQVMETSLRVLGAEHPDTLTSMANLASTYRNQGRWKEAEELDVQVMETNLRVLRAEHPDTLTSIANLASTFWNQGRWKEAEELDVQVMETRKRVLGDEHPDTLTSIANLASTYRNQGRWKEAEELDSQVMETRKRVLGDEHPDTLTSIANLASTYRNQGRWKEAEELDSQVMETRKRVLGDEHPDTLTSIANLASTYRNQGRWKEAEELDSQVMETRKRVLGEEHPDTLTSIANLASTFWNQGRWKEAEELDSQVMETRKRVLGDEHPDTLTSIANLASTFWNQGQWKEAEELNVQVMETRKRVLGEEHPDTLTSMNNLAFTLEGRGQDTDAIKLMEKCVQLRRLVLGANHPHTLSSSAALNGWQTETLGTYSKIRERVAKRESVPEGAILREDTKESLLGLGSRLQGRHVAAQSDQRSPLDGHLSHSLIEAQVNPSASEGTQPSQATTSKLHPASVPETAIPHFGSLGAPPAYSDDVRPPQPTAKFEISLDIDGYIRHELQKAEVTNGISLGRLLVIVGGARDAWCTTCDKYLEWRWPRMGPIVLQIIGQWYREVLQQQNASAGHFDTGDSVYTWQLSKHSSSLDLLIVAVSGDEGSGPIIFEVAEVLTWLSCVFCKRSGSGLQKSVASPPESTSVGYKIISSSLTDISRDAWTCWHPLFPNKVIVTGFQIPDRPASMKGLEIDFGLLIELAGIDYPVSEDGGIHLEGLYTMLYPMKIHSANIFCLQWHLSCAMGEDRSNEKKLAAFKRASMPKRWYKTNSLAELQNPHRHFLGWCDYSVITLGTKGQNYSEVKRSKADKKLSITAELSTTLTFGATFHGVGANIGKTWQRLPSERNAFEGLDLNCQQRLLWALGDQILLYQWRHKQAWLVPKTSVLLHLIITSMHKMASKDETLSFKYPYTKLGYDGGQNAYETLKENWDYELAYKSPEPLWKFVTRLLGAFDLLVRAPVGTFNREVLGWEFMDLIVPPTKSHCRRARLPKRAMFGGWGKLLPDIPLVLFYDKIDDPIIPQPHQVSTDMCPGQRMPKNENLLAANVKSIQDFAERYDGDLKNRGQLSSICFWHSLRPPFLPCGHLDRTVPEFLQLFLQFIRLDQKTPPRTKDLSRNSAGAVVFSSIPG